MKNIDTYQEGCLKTESLPKVFIENGKQAVALIQALTGIVDLGKRSDVAKKHLFYKRPAPDIDKLANLRAEDWAEVKDLDTRTIRLLHCILGVQSELEELTEPVLAHITDGKPLDLVNIMEELGDIAWYLSIGLDAVDYKFSDALQRNRVKLLEKRYKKGYSDDAANVRDLDSERKALEAAMSTASSECLMVAELLAHDSLRDLYINKKTNEVSVTLEDDEAVTLEPAEGETLTDVLAGIHAHLLRTTCDDCEANM